MADRLADAVSPYLQQHRDNPVDWWEWGDDAFAEAARRDVPVFLSIGYATCHWCHVMAHECFEDDEVARALDAFVCIKVDREERPDVDAAYMAVCQAMTGSGGWPLTVLLAPDKRPFFAATYLPKHGRGGRMGLLDLAARVHALWAADRASLLHPAGPVLEHLAEPDRRGGPEPAWAWIDGAVQALTDRFDAEHGGFGTAPKFPSPHNLRLLLRHHARSGDEAALGRVLRTLDAIDRGGIHDHVGGGFHRYSTDRQWHLPHFEKMLYDQATLLMAYTEAFQATGEARWAGVMADIVGYVLGDLTGPDGLVQSAEDADAGGEEGVFHSWTHDEVRSVLGEEADAFCAFYGIRPEGNFHEEATRRPTGRNLLHRAGPHDPRFDAALARLREVRAGRVAPMRDDKILTDWNGLWVAALAKAAAVAGRSDWLDAAAHTAGALLDRHRPGGVLVHRSRTGRTDGRAFLDDHAFLAWGLLELWQATQEPHWLEAARDLAARMLAFQGDDGGFWTSGTDDGLPVRRRDAYDGAVPSGNSVAAQVLVRLARATADARYEDAAWACARAFGTELERHPVAFTEFLWAVGLLLDGGTEVVVSGDGETADALWETARALYLPDALLLRRTEDAARALPWLSQYTGEAAYVCRDRACQAPVHGPAELRRSLQASRLA